MAPLHSQKTVQYLTWMSNKKKIPSGTQYPWPVCHAHSNESPWRTAKKNNIFSIHVKKPIFL